MGGCLSRSTKGFDPERDLIDLSGKVAIVTGAKLAPYFRSSLRMNSNLLT